MLRFTYLTIAAAFLALIAAPQDASAQSAKAAAQVKDLTIFGLTDVSSNGWFEVLSTNIKTANKKDLFISPSLECMLVTETSVKGNKATAGTATSDISSAESRVLVRVGVDGDDDGLRPDDIVDGTDRLAYPQGGTLLDLNNGGGITDRGDGVTYCQRSQELEALLGSVLENCVESNGIPGFQSEECTETEEELRLLLNSTTANTFNFVLPDVSSGMHNVVVEATIALATTDSTKGAPPAKAKAGIGSGSVIVEEVRLVKDQDELIVVD